MSFIVPDYSSVYCMSKYCVRYSYVLVAIVPMLLFLFWFTRRTFVKFQNKLELDNYLKSKKTDRRIILFLRSMAIAFVMIAMWFPSNKTRGRTQIITTKPANNE